MIHDWQSYFGDRTLEQHAEQNPNGMLDHTGPAPGILRKPAAIAYVSGSCWIADCPSGSGGAEFVNFDDPRFFCCVCRNADWGNVPLVITLPDPVLRAQIEEVLDKRPDPNTRNWTPDETVADLEAENTAQGIT
jgi:hypothetical protein